MVSLQVAMPSLRLLPLTTLLFSLTQSIAAQTPCPKPIITQPTSGSIPSRGFYVIGTTSPSCPFVTLYLNSQVDNYQTAYDDNSFSFSVFALIGQRQELSVEASNQDEPSSSFTPTFSDTVYFSVDVTQQCGGATIDEPGQTVWLTREVQESGTYPGYSTCGSITPYLNDVEWTDSTVSSSGGRWSVTLHNVPDGVYWFTIGSGTGAAYVVSPDRVQVDVSATPCDSPTITIPTPGQVFPTRFPTFQGLRTTQPEYYCGYVEYEVDGNYIGYNQAQDTTWRFTVEPPGLTDGLHTLRVRHPGRGFDTGEWSQPVQFRVSLGSQPTVS